MILNAGGRVFDAIRSVVLLQNLATPGAIVVIHHTGELWKYWKAQVTI
jgi:carbonic anhydrase